MGSGSPSMEVDRSRSTSLAQEDAASQRDTIWRAVSQNDQLLIFRLACSLQVPTVVGKGYGFLS